MTLALILGACGLLLLALAFAIAGLVYWAVTSPARERIQPLIPSHKNRDIYGDGAWNVPAQYPAQSTSARVRDMAQREAM